ncbi:hypothetical protein ACE198_01850 [Neobacillus sp. KR4-4]|uniref:hypothetical protein n=1 Tax=Neobacillus sp. KR4-4 TaxID=3344872 RepID=UPI0035CC26B1
MEKYRPNIITSIFIAISLIETFFLALAEAPRNGLEYIFLLPLTFGICLLMFRRISTFQTGGIGLKVAYFIAVIRYIILPLLLILSKGEVSAIRMSTVAEQSYYAAVIIQCIELVVFCATINYFYPRVYNREHRKYTNRARNKYPPYINFLGWCFLVVFGAILILRMPVWLPALKIFLIKENSAETKILLENTMLTCVKISLLAYFAQKAAKYQSGTKKYVFWLMLTLIWLLFNALSYFGTNRVFVLENIITSIIIVCVALPKARKWVALIVLPLSFVLMFSMVIVKQFDLTSAGQFSASTLSIEGVSNTVEEYVNGPWTIAQTYSSAADVASLERVHAFSRDWIGGLSGISDLPIIKELVQSTSNWRSSSQIMKESFQAYDRGQMLSFSGEVFIWFGTTVGWLLFPLLNYLAARCLIYIEVKSKIVDGLLYKYMYVWLSILFGLTYCYCVETIVFCWAKFIFIYWCFLKINSIPLTISAGGKR